MFSQRLASANPAAASKRRMRGLGRALLLALSTSCLTTALAAQPACGPRAKLVAALEKDFSEATVAVGLANNGMLVEVLTSASGASWTIILNRPDGTSCLVAAGESWQERVRIAGNDPQA